MKKSLSDVIAEHIMQHGTEDALTLIGRGFSKAANGATVFSLTKELETICIEIYKLRSLIR